MRIYQYIILGIVIFFFSTIQGKAEVTYLPIKEEIVLTKGIKEQKTRQHFNEMLIEGNSSICTNINATYNLSNDFIEPVTWQVSANIQIISSNNNSITIRSNSVRGGAFIIANIGGLQVRRNIWIGKAYISAGLTPFRPYYNRIDLSFPSAVNPSLLEDIIEINNIQWIIDYKSSPNIYMSANTGLNVRLLGNVNNYSVIAGRVRIENSCGVTYTPFVLVPNLYGNRNLCKGSKNDYRIQKTATNKYQVFNICTGAKEEIQSSKLYNAYGIQVEDMQIEGNEIKVGSKEQAGSVKYMKVQVNGNILTKTIIVD